MSNDLNTPLEGVMMVLGMHGGGVEFACEHNVSSAVVVVWPDVGTADSHGASATPRPMMSLDLPDIIYPPY
jgi:hypothetical protein